MVDEVLVRNVFVNNQTNELAGRFAITATAAPGIELRAIEARVRALLGRLLADGIDPAALQRMKNRREASFVRALETVSGRAAQLALSDMFTGDAGHFLGEAERILTVTPEEVHAALGRYLVERPAVVLSVVPTGKPELAASAPPSAPPSARGTAGTAATPRATSGCWRTVPCLASRLGWMNNFSKSASFNTNANMAPNRPENRWPAVMPENVLVMKANEVPTAARERLKLINNPAAPGPAVAFAAGLAIRDSVCFVRAFSLDDAIVSILPMMNSHRRTNGERRASPRLTGFSTIFLITAAYCLPPTSVKTPCLPAARPVKVTARLS